MISPPRPLTALDCSKQTLIRLLIENHLLVLIDFFADQFHHASETMPKGDYTGHV